LIIKAKAVAAAVIHNAPRSAGDQGSAPAAETDIDARISRIF
jgi:hypothetical protein